MIWERGLKVIRKIEPHVQVFGDGDMAYAICSNLISNAVKYSSDGGISISLTTGDGIRLMISNGIRDEALDLDRIWDAFYVGDASRDKSRSGTGLGLAIVKKCVQECGYTISCEKKMGEICFLVEF